jgi:outer membrane lipoprotein-sorting protein
MLRKRFGGLIAGLPLAAALGAQAPTAEELAAKNIQARGGLEKIRAVESMRMTGTMRLGDESLPTLLEIKRPAKTRWEFTLEGQTAVQAYDGTTAWMTMPFAGITEPQPMSASETADIELQADIDGPLVDSAAKGITIELVGREKVDGDVDAWRLKVKRKSGDTRDLYLDAKTYFQVLAVTRRSVDGREVEIRSRIGDYRDVSGLMLPHSFEASAVGVPETQSLKFEKVELNVPIDDSRFTMPKKTEAPAIGAGGGR